MPAAIARAPEPRLIGASETVHLATSDVGDPDAPATVAVHGFAPSAQVD